MEWLRFDAIERHYGARPVLAGASGVLRDRDKIGLVGPNGSGKSTLLRILAGLDAPDRGTVTRARRTRAGYVGQEAPADSGRSLRQVMEDAAMRLRAEEERIRELEAKIADAAAAADAAAEARLLRAYADARESHDRHGGAEFERKMRSMLAAFGLSDADLNRPVAVLSGGQRTRASIARALLAEPDYLLLDEPTNHLDVDATRFLEELLARDPRALIIVSHDRYVLDRVATAIWELDGGRVHAYRAPAVAPAYGAYVDERRRRDAEAERRHDAAMRERARREAAIAELRTHGSHNYAQVRSREKQLAKMDAPAAVDRGRKRVAVRFASARGASRGVAVSIEGLTKHFAAPLFEGLDLDAIRGERIAVVGPNGSGKSTLLKIVAGMVEPDAGEVSFGSGVKPAYFSQESAAELVPGVRALDAVMEASDLQPQRARALLGAMGLGGASADKDVAAFSGGERRRIMLARLMARDADCLLLDEPTNDLDIASREALEDALDGYAGTMLLVSHDRYLLRRLADRVLWLHDGEWSVIDGGYERYESLRRSEPAPQRAPQRRVEPDDDLSRPLVVLSKNKRASLERELARREADIKRLEATLHDLEARYADPELYVDPKAVREVHAGLGAARAEIAKATAAWEHIVETLEAAAT